MPIYEYRCESCGHQMETMQKMSDEPLTECPECHKPELKKLMSAGGFQMKSKSQPAAPCGAAAGAACPACPSMQK